jgi:hypothetical protein
MPPIPRRLPLLLALALAACGDTATAPTDRELVGTWSIAPTATVFPGSDLRQMTVSFGARGDYTVETATWAGRERPQGMVGFERAVGNVSASGGELRFHPSTALSIGHAGRSRASAFDPAAWDPAQPVSYQVLGDRLVLHLPPVSLAPSVVVLTRQP